MTNVFGALNEIRRMRAAIGLILIGFFCPSFEAMCDTYTPFAPYSNGTFILYDQSLGAWITIDEPRSNKPIPPCSTFKIPNRVAGLLVF